MSRAVRATVAALAGAVLAIAPVACGDDDTDREETQPVPGAASFGEGGFDELPRYPGAEEVADPTVENDVTSQSFSVATATPRQVFDRLTDDLSADGWTRVEDAEEGADDTFGGVWQRDDQQVVVSATTFAGPDAAGEPSTQYSYSLGPA